MNRCHLGSIFLNRGIPILLNIYASNNWSGISFFILPGWSNIELKIGAGWVGVKRPGIPGRTGFVFKEGG